MAVAASAETLVSDAVKIILLVLGNNPVVGALFGFEEGYSVATSS